MKSVEVDDAVFFVTLATPMTGLVRACHESRLDRTLEHVAYLKRPIPEGIGYLPLSRDDASLYFRPLSRRYERASLIVTSNKSGLGGGVQGSGSGNCHPGSPAAPVSDDQHQGGQPPVEGEASGGAVGKGACRPGGE